MLGEVEDFCRRPVGRDVFGGEEAADGGGVEDGDGQKDQDEGEQHVGQGQPQEAQHGKQVVGPGVLLHGRVDADGQGQR